MDTREGEASIQIASRIQPRLRGIHRQNCARGYTFPPALAGDGGRGS
jgi:hypothetical protein